VTTERAEPRMFYDRRMSTDRGHGHFDEEHAKQYEARFAKLEPLKTALHLVARLALQELPDEARVLCVGAGTGAELLALGEAFPGWRFVAVEPAAAMLDRCRARVEEAGMAERCTFHAGYLDTLAEGDPFDGATSILVSQFVVDRDQRRDFFREIARRLRDEAPLMTADLATEPQDLMPLWRRAWRYAGHSDPQIDEMIASLGKNVAVCPAVDVEALLQEAGFRPPQRCFQGILIHGWVTHKAT